MDGIQENDDPLALLEGEDGLSVAVNAEKVMRRSDPEVSETRKALVSAMQSEVERDKAHWRPVFEQIRADQDFAAGAQWDESAPGKFPGMRQEEGSEYKANFVLRHIQQRTASLYAKDPKAVAEKRQRLMSTVWDGSMDSVMHSTQVVGQITEQLQMDPAFFQKFQQAEVDYQQAIAVLQDAQKQDETSKLLDRFAQTLELFYQYNIDEQAIPFKDQMKAVVRRAVTCGVAYVRPDYQFPVERRMDEDAVVPDATQKLATVERLTADVADAEITETKSPEKLEQLTLLTGALEGAGKALVRTGLVFEYPPATSIIPDRKCTQLKGFMGADRVTREHVLTTDQVKEIFGVDLQGGKFTGYSFGAGGVPEKQMDGDGDSGDPADGETTSDAYALVWETYNRVDGLVYMHCDGYPDFLQTPARPRVWTERFFPWYVLSFNDIDHPTRIYPPSDVQLLCHQQREYNRLRQGLREHRKANRPMMVAGRGTLSTDDKSNLQDNPGNVVVELDGMQPTQKVGDVLMPLQRPGIDPNLYEVGGVFDDATRVVGTQEANYGGTSGSTATESSIAESSRLSSQQSATDELDSLLTQLARAGGQILMSLAPEADVKEVVGQGAVWMKQSREDLAKEVWLVTKAGSAGRPNAAQEINNFERMAPILMQVPGISPEAMARQAIRRLDDSLRLEDMYDANLPSIAATNQIAGSAAGGAQQNAGPDAPAQQGAEGAQNAQSPDQVRGNPGGVDVTEVQGGPPGLPQ